MPKRSEKPKDVNEIAHAMMQAIANGEVLKTPDGKDPIAVLMGRRGGLKGGKARAASMTPKRRSEERETGGAGTVVK